MPTLFCFGYGYCAQALARRLSRVASWRVIGTSRKEGGLSLAQAASQWDSLCPTHVLVSIPPQPEGDCVLASFESLLRAPSIEWVGYLSTTGVYGDWQGAWVDESTVPAPTSPRAVARLQAEALWHKAHPATHLFRLAGIYGPGRHALLDVAAGHARIIHKPGQVFSRIHVDDIARALEASILNPTPQQIFNLADNMPSSAGEVLRYASALLRQPDPPVEHFESAFLSPMAQEFYANCRRVSSRKIQNLLGIRWRYPSYREGLQALFKNDMKR